MGQDFKALYPWAEEDLERLALKERRKAGYRDNELTFCAWECWKRLEFTRGVQIKFFRIGDHPDPAFVRFDPLELHIAHEIRRDAEAHDGQARLIMLHEAAHVRLHNNGKNSFSPFGAHDEKKNIKEWSVEWHANTWAGYFLLPDSVLALFESVEQIVEMCKVDAQTAEFRLDQFRSKQRRMRGSDVCIDCGGVKVLNRFGQLICETCDT
jgi:hypothetical protein